MIGRTIKRYCKSQFLRYCFIGSVNTIVGFGVIFVLMSFGLVAEVANLIGYCVGIIVSFILNSHFTFGYRNNQAFFRFCISMGISYLLNILILMLCYRLLYLNAYMSQVFAGIVYMSSGFLLSKHFVFKESHRKDNVESRN